MGDLADKGGEEAKAAESSGFPSRRDCMMGGGEVPSPAEEAALRRVPGEDVEETVGLGVTGEVERVEGGLGPALVARRREEPSEGERGRLEEERVTWTDSVGLPYRDFEWTMGRAGEGWTDAGKGSG